MEAAAYNHRRLWAEGGSAKLNVKFWQIGFAVLGCVCLYLILAGTGVPLKVSSALTLVVCVAAFIYVTRRGSREKS